MRLLVVVLFMSLACSGAWAQFPAVELEGLGIEFRPVDESAASNAPLYVVRGEDTRVRLMKRVLLNQFDVESASVTLSDYGAGLTLDLTEAGADKLLRYTLQNLGKRIGILVDGVLLSAPLIREATGEAVVITGSFSQAQVQRMARQLNRAIVDRRVGVLVLYRGKDRSTAEALYQRLVFMQWQAGFFPSRMPIVMLSADSDYGGGAYRQLKLRAADLPAVIAVHVLADGSLGKVIAQRRRPADAAAAAREVFAAAVAAWDKP